MGVLFVMAVTLLLVTVEFVVPLGLMASEMPTALVVDAAGAITLRCTAAELTFLSLIPALPSRTRR